jgi:hypothetical protein
MDRIKQRLNTNQSKNSVNTDSLIKLNMEGSERLLPTNDINKIVNVAERFNLERQRCTFYRIIGTINPTISNSLFNLNDSTIINKFTYAGFNNLEFLDMSYPKDNDVIDGADLTYGKAIDTFLKEHDGWFGYNEPDLTKPSLCTYYDMEPKRERFSLLPDTSPYHSTGSEAVKNWELTITYPKTMDKTHAMVNGGLLLIDALPIVVSNRGMVALGVPCRHNLQVGDVVKVTGTGGYNGDYVVVQVGLANGDLKEYYFVLDIPSTGTINQNSRFKKVVGGVESEYYFRKYRKIATKSSQIIETDDYETYQAGFSENIYNDLISQFVFNEDIDVNSLTDNLNRPLSQLYLTIIKTDSNNLFTNVSSGIEIPFISNLNTSNINTYLQKVPCISQIHNGNQLPFPSHTPLENNVSINNNNLVANNNDFYGDIVEYNKFEIRETPLGVISHRFNTLNRETTANLTYINGITSTIPITPILANLDLGPRQEGYYYQPHHLIHIRDFSNYIEEGDKYTVGVPDYAINLGDDRYLWRDLIEIGFNESNAEVLDYPFLNGSHYMYQNYILNVKRQDPFGNWNLYYNKFPSDPIGDRITDNFTTKTSDTDVC